MDDFFNFLNDSPSPYHAVAQTRSALEKASFTELREDVTWSGLTWGSKHYVVRNHKSIVAFRLPTKKKEKEHGNEKDPGLFFHVWAAHTDSPAIKLNPEGFFSEEGVLQASMEIYGSPIMETWMDRELVAAGAVWTKGNPKSPLGFHLVHLQEPKLYIPNLAIHLSRHPNGEPNINLIEGAFPVYGLEGEGKSDFGDVLAKSLGVEKGTLLTYELFLADAMGAGTSGLGSEFIHSARLDNLAMCHAGLTGFLRVESEPNPSANVLALFDHEEVGSGTSSGANSSFLRDVLKRIHSRLVGGDEPFSLSMQKSFLVSADMANAVHPNHPEAHEARFKTVMGEGPVIKINAKRRYATSPLSEAFCRHFCGKKNIPLQRFILRPEMPGGTTIGPLLAAKLGVQTIDLGSAMWSMHSIRETMHKKDHEYSIDLAKAFFLEDSIAKVLS